MTSASAGVPIAQATSSALVRRAARKQEEAGGGECERHPDRDGPARREVARGRAQVAEHADRSLQRAAAADADVEPVGEDEACPPERDAEDEDGRERPGRLPQPLSPDQDVERLRCEHEHAVGVRRAHDEPRDRPERPRAPPAPLERPQQREVRDGAGEEEDAVHAAVDPVEEEHPRARGQDRRHERGRPVGEARRQRRQSGQARDGEERRDEAEPGEASARVDDCPREHVVERGAAAHIEHGVEQAAERAAPHEEGECLVLVRRPRVQPEEEEHADSDGARRHPCGERARRDVPCRGAGFGGGVRHGDGVLPPPAALVRFARPCRSTSTSVRTGICSSSFNG